jgi:hypothetical protein
MSHYVITIDGPPHRSADRDGSERRLLVTGDDGEQRPVTIALDAAGATAATDEDATWRAAIFYAVEEVELALRGENWGVHLEGGPPFVVTATQPEIARFVGEHTAGVPLDDGAVVGEFGL